MAKLLVSVCAFFLLVSSVALVVAAHGKGDLRVCRDTMERPPYDGN